MSKKSRRKTLKKKEGIISRGSFSTDDSKLFILASLIMFHVVPLILIAFGEIGKEIYAQAFYLSANLLFLAIAGVTYGIKRGFNMTFPFIMGGLAILSIIFYGEFSVEMAITGRVVFAIVYLLWSYVAVIVGALFKHLMRW